MTAEVIIMNKQAVALAADSAVTIQGSKVLNSANKLFMLAPTYPVGILIFNSAELMGISWEIIIHLYRSYLIGQGKRFDKLEEYMPDFIDFLKQNKDILFSKSQQDVFVNQYLEVLFQNDLQANIIREIKETIAQRAQPLGEADIKDISLKIIESVCKEWESASTLSNSEGVEQTLEQSYRKSFDDKYQYYLGGLPLGSDTKKRLWKLFVSTFTKDMWFIQRFTGIAFAGFGDKELFPTFVVMQLESYVENYLKYKEIEKFTVDLMNKPAVVKPLAQDDVVTNFITGVHPLYMHFLQNSFINHFSASSSSENAVRIFKEITDSARREMQNNFIDPIIRIVASLPKDDLANMAETLVSMTSFMRRVSSNLETVGGPIDVAVISRKDGFIWIKRKHYFDQEHNYHFFDDKNALYQSIKQKALEESRNDEEKTN
jgi:succinate dehydrogenase/fumarate reductase cytochrome b subunit